MTTTRPAKKASRTDWQPPQVICELRLRSGLTLAKLAAKHGVSRQVMSRALHRTYPLSEARIAEAIGVHPMTIWPSRYNADGSVTERRGQPSHKAKVTSRRVSVNVNDEGVV